MNLRRAGPARDNIQCQPLRKSCQRMTFSLQENNRLPRKDMRDEMTCVLGGMGFFTMSKRDQARERGGASLDEGIESHFGSST